MALHALGPDEEAALVKHLRGCSIVPSRLAEAGALVVHALAEAVKQTGSAAAAARKHPHRSRPNPADWRWQRRGESDRGRFWIVPVSLVSRGEGGLRTEATPRLRLGLPAACRGRGEAACAGILSLRRPAGTRPVERATWPHRSGSSPPRSRWWRCWSWPVGGFAVQLQQQRDAQIARTQAPGRGASPGWIAR
ncbi:hypothetical protein HBB16_10130 [Pseudonocardia sp. MCCB 268]|nr:hypothetical protein [Pseudonocardia cytotoxica]